MDHKDLTFTRMIKASPAHVYHCMTDAKARMVWNSPDADMVFIVKDPAPASPGGRETGQVGPKDNPYVTAHADWIITEPGERLVYAETLEAEGMVLTTSLACATLEAVDGGTQLTQNVHVTSFTGIDSMVEVEQGWTYAFEAMSAFAES